MRGTPCLDGGLQKKSQLINSAVEAGRKKKIGPAELASVAAQAALAALAASSASAGPLAPPRLAVQQRHHVDPAGQNLAPVQWI